MNIGTGENEKSIKVKSHYTLGRLWDKIQEAYSDMKIKNADIDYIKIFAEGGIELPIVNTDKNSHP